MKKALLFGLLVAFSSLVDAKDGKRVNFELTNGNVVSFTLDQTPQIKYTEKTVTVTCSDGTIEYGMSEIKKVTMSNFSADGVAEVTVANDNGNMSVSNGVFLFEGFPSGSNVSVIDMSGKVIRSYKIGNDGSLNLDTSDLQSGTYIIKTTGTTYKFCKQ